MIDYNINFGLQKLWKWKVWILVACLMAGGISIFFSLQIRDEYRSAATFVPPSFSALGTMTFGNGIAYRGFYAADEEDLDRTIDYMNSTAIVDSLAKIYDLYNHYGIDPDHPKKDKMFYQSFFIKNEVNWGGAANIVVECWDVEPERAYNMVQSYLGIAEKYFESISKRKAGMASTERALADMEKERVMILDSLAFFRSEYNIYHLDQLGEEITKIMARQMQNEPEFHKNYDKVRSLEVYLSTLELRYGDLQREYMTRKLNMEQFPSLIWMTQEASIPTFKGRPKRSIIVILSVMATFVLSCFLVILLDRSKMED